MGRAKVTFALLLGLLVLGGKCMNLVAYFQFENSIDALAGSCEDPRNVNLITTPNILEVGNVNYVPGIVGQAIEMDENSLVRTSSWVIGSSTSFSIAVWVKVFNTSDTFSTIFAKTLNAGIRIWGLTVFQGTGFRFIFSPNGLPAEQRVQVNTGLVYDTWHHVVGTYDGTTMRLYVDNVEVAAQAEDGELVELVGRNNGVGASVDSLFPSYFRGCIDELRIYDYALDPGEVNELFVIPDTPDSFRTPEVTAVSNSQSIKILDGADLFVEATNPAGPEDELSYLWSLDSSDADGGCSAASIFTPFASETKVTFGNTTGTYEFAVCITNSQGSSSALVSVQAQSFAPEIITQPASEIEAFVDETARLEVTGRGFPTPIYVWQILLPININNRTQRTTNGFQVEFANFNEELFAPEHRISMEAKLTNLLNDYYNGYVTHAHLGTYFDTPDQHLRGIIDNTTNVWVEIPNANLPVYITDPLTLEDDMTFFRCVVVNNQGSNETDPIMLRVSVPVESSGGGGDEIPEYVWAIAAVLACCICCLVILILFIVVIFYIGYKRSHRPRYTNLVQPDFQELIFEEGNEPQYVIDKTQKRELEAFETFILENPVVAISVIYQASRDSSLLRAVVWIYQYHRKGYALLEDLISQEVETSDEEGTLFRSSSVACLFFSTWVRTIGMKYVWKTLVIPVNELNDNARKLDEKLHPEDKKHKKRKGKEIHGGYKLKNVDEDTHTTEMATMMMTGDMEIDPAKIEESSADRKVNTLQLWLVAQKLFNAILQSENEVPEEIRMLLQHVYTTVEYRHDKLAAYRAMGAFFFLRFLMPCLLAPHRWGLLTEPPHKVAQRQLILLGKVLQNLANNTWPGNKEGYMEQFNDFVDHNQQPLLEWYGKLSKSQGPTTMIDVPESIRLDSLIILYRYVYDNDDDVGEHLVEVEEVDQEVTDELDSLLIKIGKI